MSFAPLQLVDGPACPSCGSQDAEILQRPSDLPEGVTTWWEQGRARCRHCGNQFAFRELPEPIAAPAVVDEAMEAMDFEPADVQPVDPPAKPRDTAYPVRECPHCGSADTGVYKPMRKKPDVPQIRYHRCGDCQKTFKSIDSRHCAREENR